MNVQPQQLSPEEVQRVKERLARLEESSSSGNAEEIAFLRKLLQTNSPSFKGTTKDLGALIGVTQ